MRDVHPADLTVAIHRFQLNGDFVDVRPLKRGHIHDTFVSRWDNGEGAQQFIHQRINDDVFPDLDLLMSNIHLVSEHLVTHLGEDGADGFELLRLVPTRQGDPYAATDSGAWRTYFFIENTASFDRPQSRNQAFEAARAFGWFQAQLRDLPADQLGETLEDFFSTPFRYRQFEAALAAAPVERRESAADAIRFAVERRGMVDVIATKLLNGEIPTRVVHGDTKLNNILFDLDTGKAKAIVDLDTVMPGYSLYDFGDLVRFTAARSKEDETDLALVGTDPDLYDTLAEGYLSTAGSFLTDGEIALMPFAARLVTFTIGLRFLADHLAGDHYFKIARPGHNLDRARVQFGMVADMERHAGDLRAGT